MERGVIQSRRQLPGVRRRRLQLAHQRRKLWMHWTRLCVAPNGSRLVGMKRQLDLHGNVVASFCPTTMDALTVSRRGAHREASCQMDTIGLDLHKRESQLCIGHADGTITERRIVTSRERFTAVLGHRPRARILLEASTESEWVAQHLEALGHEVIVADPNYAPMYATR